jgi:hypothetical protein
MGDLATDVMWLLQPRTGNLNVPLYCRIAIRTSALVALYNTLRELPASSVFQAAAFRPSRVVNELQPTRKKSETLHLQYLVVCTSAGV